MHENSPAPGPRTVRGGAKAATGSGTVVTAAAGGPLTPTGKFGESKQQLFGDIGQSADTEDDSNTNSVPAIELLSPNRADILGIGSSTSTGNLQKQASTSSGMFSRFLGRESKL